MDVTILRSRLEGERTRLLLEVRDLRDSEKAPGRRDENSGYGNHLADDASETFEHEKNQALMRNLQCLLQLVNHALQKIDEGTYGLCDRCQQPIGEERLMALPHATLCVHCKAREEKGR